MCSQGGLITLRMGNMWYLNLYLGRAQSPLSLVLLIVFWSFSPGGMNL